MSALSLSRRVRLGITAGVLATAGIVAALSASTASAADGVPIIIDANQTKINSVAVLVDEIAVVDRDGARNILPPWVCVKDLPHDGRVVEAGVESPSLRRDPGITAAEVIVNSYTSADCSGEELHRDGVNAPVDARSGKHNFWTIPLRTLDDDDSTPWTQ